MSAEDQNAGRVLRPVGQSPRSDGVPSGRRSEPPSWRGSDRSQWALDDLQASLRFTADHVLSAAAMPTCPDPARVLDDLEEFAVDVLERVALERKDLP